MAVSIRFHWKEHWREMKRGRPGHRFQDRYKRARDHERRGSAGQRIILIAAGLVCLAIGAVLSVFPGPAIPFFFLAGGLLATESKIVAKFMDWAEVRVRKIVAWGKQRWRRLSTPARVGVVVLAACCSAGGMFLTYRIMTG